MTERVLPSARAEITANAAPAEPGSVAISPMPHSRAGSPVPASPADRCQAPSARRRRIRPDGAKDRIRRRNAQPAEDVGHRAAQTDQPHHLPVPAAIGARTTSAERVSYCESPTTVAVMVTRNRRQAQPASPAVPCPTWSAPEWRDGDGRQREDGDIDAPRQPAAASGTARTGCPRRWPAGSLDQKAQRRGMDRRPDMAPDNRPGRPKVVRMALTLAARRPPPASSRPT